MHRWTLLVFCTLFVAAAALLFVMAGKPDPAQAEAARASVPSGVVPADPSVGAGQSNVAEEPSELPADSGTSFGFLPDGGQVPDLPRDAPKSVGFGVILVQYGGAQLAPKNARSKAEALQRAKDLAREAVQDFEQAVGKGDRGSTADAGSMPRGILEPAVEYALFSLKQGAVHPEPIDTPRGYWVIRRLR
jgi:hypothetical protein